MSNKLDELKISIQNTNSSIILITESWLNSKIPDALINIPGFTLHRKDRESSHGGGVCIYVKDHTAGHTVTSTISRDFDTIGSVESIWLDICINQIRIIVACIYRPNHNC